MGRKRRKNFQHLGKQYKLSPSLTLPDLPSPGDIYRDTQKRTLRVVGVFPGDPLGRQVQGIVSHPKQSDRAYSTTLEMWREIWRDKVEPQDPSGMRI